MTEQEHRTRGWNRKTDEQFQAEMAILHPELEILEPYPQNNKIKIKVRCKICGYVSEKKPNQLLLGQGCQACGEKMRHENKKIKPEVFEQRLKAANPVFKLLTPYQDCRTKVQLQCSECDYIWEAAPFAALKRHACPKCSKRPLVTHEDFLQVLHEHGDLIKPLGIYQNQRTHIQVQCTKCQHVWNPLPGDLMRGSGCPECTKTQTSLAEWIIYYAMCCVFGANAVQHRDRQAINAEIDVYIPMHKTGIELGAWYFHSTRQEQDVQKYNTALSAGLSLIVIYDGMEDKVGTASSHCWQYAQNLGSENKWTTLRYDVVPKILQQMHVHRSFSDNEWNDIIKQALKRKGKKTRDVFWNEMHAKHPTITLLGDYLNDRTKTTFMCNTCGFKWQQPPYALLKGRGCHQCHPHTNQYLKRRLYTMKLDPIIISLLDQDLYKLNMGALFASKYMNTCGQYHFKCRNAGVKFTPEMHEEIKAQIDHLCTLRFTEDELNYLRSIRFMKRGFVDFLDLWQPQRKYVTTNLSDDGELSILVEGPLFKIMYFEIYLLEIVNEVYFRMQYDYDVLVASAREKLDAKIAKFKDGTYNFKFAEFGCRRRLSREWEDEVVRRFAAEVPNMVGTSNVYLAKKYGLTPIGTYAHEYVQMYQGIDHIPLAYTNHYALQDWYEYYKGDNGTALTDTLGTDLFLMDFDRSMANNFTGVRHDSGDPYEWGEKMITHYESYGIDPKTKTLLFSDSLNFDKAQALHDHFKDRTKVSFGIGTFVSNDTCEKALNIVIKLQYVNGRPVAKISDNPGKAMCQDAGYLDYLKNAVEFRLKREAEKNIHRPIQGGSSE